MLGSDAPSPSPRMKAQVMSASVFSKNGKSVKAAALNKSVSAIMCHSFMWRMRTGIRSRTAKLAAEKLPRIQPISEGVHFTDVQ